MTEAPTPTPGPQDPLQSVLDDADLLDGTDLPAQVPIYERLHASLASALARTVDQTGPGSGGR